jgi:hypothetical protein
VEPEDVSWPYRSFDPRSHRFNGPPIPFPPLNRQEGVDFDAPSLGRARSHHVIDLDDEDDVPIYRDGRPYMDDEPRYRNLSAN